MRDAAGVWHDDPAVVDKLLWDSRAEVWSSAPPVAPAAQALLDEYFRDRHVSFPQHPRPEWTTMARVILGAGGSAPGLDSEPYEVYHYGVRFVACLLGQASYAAALGDDLLQRVLGPSVDLLVWILKHPRAERVGEMRPLQLPPCFRRLFGAVVAGEVGSALPLFVSLEMYYINVL